MSKPITQILAWSKKRSYLATPLMLGIGFILDIFTLNRIDEVFDNAILITHLLLVGISIALLYNKETQQHTGMKWPRLYTIAQFIVPFSLGGLLSGFVVFYGRSASLSTSWGMLLILVLMMISTETMKAHYRKLSIQLSIYYLTILLYLIFFFPVIFSTLGVDMFLLSIGASLLFFFGYLILLSRINKTGILHTRNATLRSVGITTGLLLLLYFTNLIPPIPLSLSSSGVYHSVIRSDHYIYRAEYEPTPWWNILRKRSRTAHWQSGHDLFVFTSIFAPTHLDTIVIHEWQEKTSEGWKTRSTITLPISGGRKDGFRTYSKKSHLSEGVWRVRVTNERGQVLGIVRFRIITAHEEPETDWEIL